MLEYHVLTANRLKENIERQNSMKWDELINNIIQTVGIMGINNLENALDDLRDQIDEPWKKSIMDILADTIEKYGLEGIQKIQDLVNQIADGDKPDMSFMNLKSRSDVLAMMQNMEADKKSKARDFFMVIGETLGVIFGAIIKGLLK